MILQHANMQKIKNLLSKTKRCLYTAPIVLQIILYYLYGILSRKKTIVISLFEHIGDIVSCEPVVRYVKEKVPNANIIWVVSVDYRELLLFNPNIFRIVTLRFFYQWILASEILLKILPGDSIIDLHISGKPDTKYGLKLLKFDNGINFNNYLLGRNQLQAFSIAAGINAINLPPKFYLSGKINFLHLDQKYIVVHTQSNMPMKDWPKSKWIQFCDAIMNKGYFVFEVGLKKQIESNDKRYIDFTGKKSLQEIAHLISKCLLYIGIDSGFAHLANALDKEGVVLVGQYKIDSTVFEKYNPFSGKYSDSSNLIFSKNGTVENISVDDVLVKVFEKLNFNG